MPDISELNGTAIDNVAKVDGLAKASILDIDGVAVPSAVAAPAAAYSVRLLGSAVGISSYTGACMRVRRASDNVEADVAFDTSLTDPALSLNSAISNTSDAQSYTDFADFVDHTGTPTDAFVRYWYDQSGNANDAGQSTAGSQPQIYDAATGLITENGKPIIKSNDRTDGFSSIAVDMSGSTISMTSVSRSEHPSTNVLCYLIPPVDERMMLGQNGSTLADGGQGGFTFTGAELFWNGSSQGTSATRGEVFTQFYQNQTLATWVGLSDVNGTAIYLSQAQSYWQMHSMQEIIFWESDQSTNRTAFETNIANYYGITL